MIEANQNPQRISCFLINVAKFGASNFIIETKGPLARELYAIRKRKLPLTSKHLVFPQRTCGRKQKCTHSHVCECPVN